MVRRLVQLADGRIVIMAGSGINHENVKALLKWTGVTEIHASSRTTFPSNMKYKRGNIFMGGLPEIPEFEISQTDSNKIKLILQSVREY